MKSIKSFAPFKTSFGKNIPFEREYEGWVMREMEDYFHAIGLGFACMATSPNTERDEGLDEFCKTGGKIFGLQFKRPYFWQPTVGSHGIKWLLNDPKHQYPRIVERPNIFYALPTFLNRELRRGSLNHVFFWRPDLHDGERLYLKTSGSHVCFPESINGVGNLDEAAQRKSFEMDKSHQTKHAYRWGRFAERLLTCNMGASLAKDKLEFRRSVSSLSPMDSPLSPSTPVTIVVNIFPLNSK